jgi:hypothetical protein
MLTGRNEESCDNQRSAKRPESYLTGDLIQYGYLDPKGLQAAADYGRYGTGQSRG